MRLFVIGILAVWFCIVDVAAQATSGRMMLSQGTSFMVAFPKVWAESSEKPMPQPLQIIVSSSVSTTIRVTTPAAEGSTPALDRTYAVKANTPLIVPISTAYLPGESTSIAGLAIAITSEHPISVYTYQSWMGNGEMTQHLPLYAWGTEHTAMSSFQDRFGSSAEGFRDRSGQIVVIAREDSTQVTITPTVALEGGPSADDHPRGVPRTYTLHRGQTLYTTAAIIPEKHGDYSTDLSGTSIRSTKPVAVISGHTKGAVMRMPALLPPTGRYAATAHFVRNSMHDVMLPHSMAGTQFTTSVLRYTPTRVTGQTAPGMDDDRGDVVRVIALHNSTVVRRSRLDGQGLLTVAILDSGESYLDTVVQHNYYWEANNPVLVGQYGKSWAKIITAIRVKSGDDDHIMGHPTVESGMPFLQMIPPIDRWIDRAVFHNPEGMDNFITITYRLGEADSILINGKPLSVVFGGAARRISSTEYFTITAPYTAGTVVITSKNPSVRWMAWTYGSLDGFQQGRAYGTPVGINCAMPYDDSLSVMSTVTCTDVSGTFAITGEERSAIAFVDYLDTSNVMIDPAGTTVTGQRSATFRVSRRSPDLPGRFRIRAVTTSGRYEERTFTIDTVGQLTASRPSLDVGNLSSYDDRLDTITITSLSPEPTEVALSLARGAAVRIVSEPVVTASAASPARVIVASRGQVSGPVTDTLIATTLCGGADRVCTIRGRYTPPTFGVSAPSFMNATRGIEYEDTAELTYTGNARVALRSVRASAVAGDTSAFTCTTLDGTPFREALPMVLDSGDVLRLLVRFRSTSDDGTFETMYRIPTSDNTVTITMRVRATVRDTTTSVEGVDRSSRCFITVAPSPVIDNAQVSITAHHGGPCAISVTDMTGRVVGTFDVVLPADHTVVVPIPFISTLPSGVYSLRATVGTQTASTSLHVVR